MEEFVDEPNANQTIATAMWTWGLGQPRDELVSSSQVWEMLKRQILEGEWNEALDVIEVYVERLRGALQESQHPSILEPVIKAFNDCFEQFLVGYRFVDQKIIPLDGEIDVCAIEIAYERARDFSGARGHLRRASDLLADRKQPDYSNSVKESILAVESVVKAITGKNTLGGGLKRLRENQVEIHPVLENAWGKMYGWTSDADGIRHAGIEPATTGQAIAKYMLVASSAFVTYLIESGRKAQLVETQYPRETR